MQDGWLIAYNNKKLNSTEKNHTTPKKNFSIAVALEEFGPCS